MKHMAITAASAAVLALAGVETAGVVAAGPSPDTSGCDSWIGPGSESVEGRPPDFQAATAPGTYIWHDCQGWHLRTLSTDPHGNNGAVGTLLIDGGRFRVATGFHLSPRDTFTASDTLLRYHFKNDSGKDGLDFRISGETLTFHIQDSPGATHAVYLGRTMQAPRSHTFTVYHVGADGGAPIQPSSGIGPASIAEPGSVQPAAASNTGQDRAVPLRDHSPMTGMGPVRRFALVRRGH